jgi:hypothetical protein
MRRLSLWAFPAFLILIMVLKVYAGYENKKLIDPNSSEHKPGFDIERNDFIPPTPDFDKVDFAEFNDYEGKAYSPYAELQILHPVQIGKVTLQPGYYLIKLVVIPPFTTKRPGPAEKMSNMMPFHKSSPEDKVVQNAPKGSPPPMSMIIKQAGSVKTIVPIHHTEPLIPKMKSGSTAQLIKENEDPLQPQLIYLKYCAGSFCYKSVPLKPGLVQ